MLILYENFKVFGNLLTFHCLSVLITKLYFWHNFKQVSWVRHRDIHLITVGRYTYTTDQRFRAILQPSTDEYTLMIKYPQHRDSGIYECQVSTTPHLSHYVHLSVVGKRVSFSTQISYSSFKYQFTRFSCSDDRQIIRNKQREKQVENMKR